VKTGSRKIEIGVETEHRTPEQDGRYVDQQEEGQIGTRSCLQPGHLSLALLPALQHQPRATPHLQRHAGQQDGFGQAMAIHRAQRLHQRDMGGDAR
jgi:hypothetical protein